MHRPSSATLRAGLVLVLAACATDRPTAPRMRAETVATTGTPLIFITELISDPSRVADAAGEWFEIYNAGNTAVDLQGWKIVSGVTTPPEQHTIATSVVVLSGGYAVVGNNANTATNGGVEEQYSYPPSGAGAIILNNSNTDWLALKLPDGTVVDSVAYSARSGTTIVPPTFSPSAGVSRALKAAALPFAHQIMGDTANWANTPAGTSYGLGDRGTPGTGSYTPLVFGGEVATVTVTPATAAAVIGQTRQFGAAGRDVDGAISQTTFTWSSSDEAVASIDAATGLATALADGNTTITAQAANGVMGTATLTVTPPVVASITVAINVPRQAPVGFVKPAFPTVKDPGGTTIAPTPPLDWSSSDPSIATVDENGYITALVVGNVTITATAANGVSGTSSFAVIPATAPTSAVYRDNVEFGTPSDADPSNDIMVARPQYELSYNVTRGGPNWVSWDLNGSQFGPAPRCDCFSPDPLLPAAVYHVVDLDYRNGGYDRGHMTMSEERTTTDQENATTFYLTNVLPQAAENNQGPWVDFEIHLNGLAQAGGKEVYVIAGGEYAALPQTLKNEGRVAIPDYTWKIAVIERGGAGLGDVHGLGDLQVIAVRMPNLTTPGVPGSAVGIRTRPWQDFQTTVDAIEAATGYDFLAALPDNIERVVEANDHPPGAVAGGPYSGAEGAAIAFSAAGSIDPDGDALSYAWDFGDGTGGSGASPIHTYADNGTYTATLTVADPLGATATATTSVTILNAAPAIVALALPSSPVMAGDAATVRVTFTDAGSADTHSTTVEWGDGSSSVASGEGEVLLSHAYAAPDLYVVRATVTDDDGGAAMRVADGYVVVFDPAAGFATGSGWFSAGGKKTTFDLDARYGPQGGAPRGSFELESGATGFGFTATDVQWLVVTGGKAIVRGTGSVAGSTETLQFLLVAVDGGKDDGVRLKVWDGDGRVLYDDRPGAADDSDDVVPLGGGSIQVH